MQQETPFKGVPHIRAFYEAFIEPNVENFEKWANFVGHKHRGSDSSSRAQALKCCLREGIAPPHHPPRQQWHGWASHGCRGAAGPQLRCSGDDAWSAIDGALRRGVEEEFSGCDGRRGPAGRGSSSCPLIAPACHASAVFAIVRGRSCLA